MDRKDIIDTFKLIKKFEYCFFIWNSSSSYFQQDYIRFERNELDKKSFWEDKIIGKLLLIVTITDSQ